MRSDGFAKKSPLCSADKKEGLLLGVGKRAIEVGGDEVGAGDKRAPFLGNAPESDQRLRRQSWEDVGDNPVWETVWHGRRERLLTVTVMKRGNEISCCRQLYHVGCLAMKRKEISWERKGSRKSKRWKTKFHQKWSANGRGTRLQF